MTRLRGLARALASGVPALLALAGPWLDLLIRLWLAQAFLVAQVRQMMGGAPGLSAPLGAAWWADALHGVMVSSAGLLVQTACPVLLALGLLARPAALAIFVRAVVLAGMGAAGPGALFWMAPLGRVVLLGPGAVSLDSLPHRGADSIAIPGGAAMTRMLDAVHRWPGQATRLRCGSGLRRRWPAPRWPCRG